MKFITIFLLATLVAALLGPFIPFWGLMIIIAFCGALVGGRRRTAFIAGGLGVGLVWLAVPLWITISTGSELPGRIGGIMGFENPFLLVLITCLVGFLLGGLSTWTGSSFRKLFHDPKGQRSPYYH